MLAAVIARRAPPAALIRPEAMRAAEEAAREVVLRVHPTEEAEQRRQDVIGYAKRLIGTSLGCEEGEKREQTKQEAAKKMAAVPDCVSSCGSTNVRRVDRLLPLPLPCVGEPTAASCVSPGSSPARSDAFEGAADAEPEPEASAGRRTQMLLAMAAVAPAAAARRRPTAAAPRGALDRLPTTAPHRRPPSAAP